MLSTNGDACVVLSASTTFNASTNSGLPAAGPSQPGFPGGTPGQGGDGDGRFLRQGNTAGDNRDQSLLNYLLANTRPGTYLLATDQANDAAAYILSTGRPVLAIGGFLGQYQEVSVEQFAALVNAGRLRFVLRQSLRQYQDISQWVQQNCKTVDTSSLSGANTPAFGGPGNGQQGTTLYDCGK